MLAGGLRALRQHDLKLLLAFGTVSQLGFMFLVMGAGTAEAATGGSLLLLAHAIYKAALFMVVGIIDHETGTRDMRALPGFGRRWRPVVAIGVVDARRRWPACPWPSASWPRRPTSRSSPATRSAARGWCSPGVTVGSVLTVAYSIRFVWGAFTAGATDWANAPAGRRHAATARRLRSWLPPPCWPPAPSCSAWSPPSPTASSAPPPRPSIPPSSPSTSRSGTASTSPLVLSAVALAGGALLFVARRPVARVLAAGRRIPSGADVYLLGLRGLNVVADRVTGVVQTRLAAVLRGP